MTKRLRKLNLIILLFIISNVNAQVFRNKSVPENILKTYSTQCCDDKVGSQVLTSAADITKYLPQGFSQKGDTLMAEILKMQDEFISRISHTEPGNVKGFYKKLRADFNAKVDEIIDAMGKLK
jgi:hypothetical protein